MTSALAYAMMVSLGYVLGWMTCGLIVRSEHPDRGHDDEAADPVCSSVARSPGAR